ncbi:ankyrin repeat domain-containing protein [Aureivirga sp. CE67]|uniref:ankyrin repeat domain-containing protein n=1 Tax=Aureivirga sp. CE67 TaxID=1788983 RepID=UPI0018CB1AE0|nr:ankyrin repeat domain-containing protein [Aureivirga sp. CE67]
METIEDKVVDLVLYRDIEEIIKLIESKEFDVNSFISLDRSALTLAAACNYTDVMECLIANGADINLNNEGDLGYTPIETAAREGKLEAVQLLIDHGAEIDKGNTINTNALLAACIGRFDEVVKLLLDNGADIHHKDNNGQTALDYLCRYAISWSNNVTITETIDGVTTEKENTSFQEHTRILELLLSRGANPNLETAYNYTAFQIAVVTDSVGFIDVLLKHGADINYVNSNGATALYLAASNNISEEMLQLLLENKADYNFQTSLGNSPLHIAANHGDTKFCEMLLSSGANIDIENESKGTPLLYAVWNKKIDTAKILLEKGARTDIKVTEGSDDLEIGDDAATLIRKNNIEELMSYID